MRGREPDPVIAELAATLRLRLDDLVDELVDLTRAQIDLYKDDTVVPRAMLAANLRRNIERSLDQLQYNLPVDVSTAERTGRERAAMGVPLPELLRAYTLGFSLLWKWLLDAARAAGSRETKALTDAAADLWLLNLEFSTAVTEAYRDQMTAIMVAEDRRRSALVATLLDGSADDRQTAWEISQTLGLPFEGAFVVVAAESTPIADKAKVHLEDVLRRRGTASAWRSQPDREIGIIYRGSGQTLADILEVVSATAAARVGVSPEFERLDMTSRAARFARTALETMPAGTVGVNQISDTPISALVIANLDSTRQFVWRVLGGVLTLPDDERGTHLATARAWLDADGSAAQAANALYCHENTVRYRMRRLEERLGCSLSSPARLAEFVAALQAINTFPDLASYPADESAVGRAAASPVPGRPIGA